MPGLVAEPRIGEPVQSIVSGDGTVVDDSVTDSTILVSAYDSITGHNVAAPFADWVARQPFPASWLIGLPLTNRPGMTRCSMAFRPGSRSRRLNVRILTWTPGQPEGWEVESNNAGLHYRTWRELRQPDDPTLVSLASYKLFGEELVSAAVANDVDPYLLAALSRTLSGGDPTALQSNGGAGLLAVRPMSRSRRAEDRSSIRRSMPPTARQNSGDGRRSPVAIPVSCRVVHQRREAGTHSGGVARSRTFDARYSRGTPQYPSDAVFS